MKKIRVNRIFLGFMLSYIIVLIIPIVLIGTLIISQVNNVLENEIKSSTLYVLHQASNTIDTRVKELDEISYQVSNNRNLRTLLNEKDIQSVDKYFTISDFNRDFASISSINKFITSIYVYINKDDIFLTPSSSYSPEMVYRSYAQQSIPMDLWLNKIKAFHNGEIWPSVVVGSDTIKENKVLTYCRSIPVNTNQNQATVVAFINDDNIKSLFETESLEFEGSYYIVDNNKNIVFSTDKRNAVLSSPILNESGEESFITYKVDGKSYIGICIPSKIAQWKYVAIIPYNAFMSKVYVIRNIIFVVIFVCLILGLALSFYLSARNYKPIKSIFNSVFKANKNQQLSAKTNYNSIIEAIQENFEEKKSLEGQMKYQLPNIKLNFLIKLLTGKYKKQIEVDEMLGVLNISFKSQLFNVIIINVDDYSDFSPEKSGYQLDLVRFIIINISEELFNENHLAFSHEEEGKVILLVNYKEMAEEDIYLETENILKKLIKIIDENFKIVLSAGVGNLCKGYNHIPGSYEEAKIALNQRIINGKNSLTLYRQISSNSSSYYYPMDVEMQIMNHVKTGDYKGAEALLEEVYNENYGKRKLPLYLVNCLSFDMAGTILKVLDSMNVDYNEVFKEKSDISGNLLRCETVQEMYEEIKSILSKVCKYINEKRESNNFELKEKVLEYIDENYSDKNLSLLLVADYFKMSNSYLSRFFKDHTGYNFIDYLSRVRIQKAKDLMENDEASITDIADMVGYNSANSFIRAFKKYESVTPGQFKEAISRD